MARTTTTSAGTRRASAAGKSSRGSRKASTRSTGHSPKLQLRVFDPSVLSSTSTLGRNLIDGLLQQHREIMRGTYAAHFAHGAVIVTLTKSEQATLLNFYNGVLREAQRLLQT